MHLPRSQAFDMLTQHTNKTYNFVVFTTHACTAATPMVPAVELRCGCNPTSANATSLVLTEHATEAMSPTESALAI